MRDLPKVEKVIGGWSTPNFGDWSRGSHTHYSIRKVYQRETWYGQGLAIRVEPDEPVGDTVRIGFIVDYVFDRNSLRDQDLLMACSLIRENIGRDASVVSTSMPVNEWIQSQRVAWEILPIGELGPQPLREIVRRLNIAPDSKRARTITERFDQVLSIGQPEVVLGTGEFTRYFGVKYRDDLVALECLDYGNALYLMYEDWKTLSKRSRIDLLADTSARYDRVIHREGWEGRLAALLKGAGYLD
ncbi:hypothetical protein A5722_17145 [Mycobacterium vulneris]|nr:hypothetical protein A5722_17145 [Mycolicibacterium vulneris]OCB65600.1 hypothetical protein A5729_15980 [Mycolicibacterium vulneris]